MEYYLAIKNNIWPFATTWMHVEGIILTERSQPKTNTVLCDLTYMWNLKRKKKLTDTENWLPGWGSGQSVWKDQKIQTSSYKINKSFRWMYSMVTVVDDTVLYYWKLLREQALKVLITRKKIVTMYDVNYTLWWSCQNVHVYQITTEHLKLV